MFSAEVLCEVESNLEEVETTVFSTLLLQNIVQSNLFLLIYGFSFIEKHPVSSGTVEKIFP